MRELTPVAWTPHTARRPSPAAAPPGRTAPATMGVRVTLALLMALPGLSGLSGCGLLPGRDDRADQRATAGTTPITDGTGTTGPTGPTGGTSATGTATSLTAAAGHGLTRADLLRAVDGLVVAERSAPEPYRRARFDEGWADNDRDCHDTRAEVLLRDATATVTFRSNGCTVDRGLWTDPWNGTSSPLASTFQIDHTIPLANAWVSGAWAWTDEQRRRFANDLDDPDALLALEGSNNTAKSDKTPDQWRPALRPAWCRYAAAWTRLKQAWSLTVADAERAALIELAGSCDD